jgi:NSS family neurotransmitter:Na+ symporter
VIIFGWIFGIDRGWAEIQRGGDLKLPNFFKYVIKYVTPTFIGVVLLGALNQTPRSWGDAVALLFSTGSWPFDPGSVIGKLLHVGATEGNFADGALTKVGVENLSRIVLVTVFVLMALLVRKAFKGRTITHERQEGGTRL